MFVSEITGEGVKLSFSLAFYEQIFYRKELRTAFLYVQFMFVKLFVCKAARKMLVRLTKGGVSSELMRKKDFKLKVKASNYDKM